MNKKKLNILVMWQVIHWYNHKVMIRNTHEYISKVFALENKMWNINFILADLNIDSSVSVPYGNKIKLDKLQNGKYDLLITGAVPHKMKWLSGNIEMIHPYVWTCTRSKWVHKNRTIIPINKSNLMWAVIQSLSKMFGYDINARNYAKINDWYPEIYQNWEFENNSY